jgi:thioredoxin 1
MVKSLKSEAELTEAFKDGKPIFLKFSATWCGPCKQAIPVVEKLAEENPTLKFYDIDVDEMSDVAERYEVELMPTFIVAKNDKIISRVAGREWPEIHKNIASAVEMIKGDDGAAAAPAEKPAAEKPAAEPKI